jgi:hypothetical protein
MPAYPTSIKVFTTKTTGDTIQASHVNDLQDEIIAIEQGLKNGLQHALRFLTDNTYDIGASGATRPRDLFVGRNVSIVGSCAAGSFTGTAGTGFTLDLAAATLSNDLPDASLSANVPLLNAANVFTGTIDAFKSLSVNAALPGTAASTGYTDYSSGMRFTSVGASGSTPGTFSFIQRGADTTLSPGGLTLDANAVLTLSGLDAADGNTLTLKSSAGAVSGGDILSTLRFESGDNSVGGTGLVAAIKTLASGAFTGSGRSTDLAFYTTSGTTTSEVLRLFASKGMSIGDTTDPGATNLRVAGTITSIGTITGTLATAAQTNITSVGTLGSLIVGATTLKAHASGGVSIGDATDPGATNLRVAGSLTVGGAFSFTNLTVSGTAYIGDTANANITQGLTINQGANDDDILHFKSSDIAHGMTSLFETDSYGAFNKVDATAGGAAFSGLTEGTIGVAIVSDFTTGDTTKSTAGSGAVLIAGQKKSGTTVGAMGADENILAVRNYGTTRFILDADGDSHQDVGTAWTNFDDHDDAALLTALSVGVSRRDDPLRTAFDGLLTQHRETLERHKIVTFNADGHHFINWSRAHMLTIGAVRQLAASLTAQAQQIATMQRTLKQLEART